MHCTAAHQKEKECWYVSLSALEYISGDINSSSTHAAGETMIQNIYINLRGCSEIYHSKGLFKNCIFRSEGAQALTLSVTSQVQFWNSDIIFLSKRTKLLLHLQELCIIEQTWKLYKTVKFILKNTGLNLSWTILESNQNCTTWWNSWRKLPKSGQLKNPTSYRWINLFNLSVVFNLMDLRNNFMKIPNTLHLRI